MRSTVLALTIASCGWYWGATRMADVPAPTAQPPVVLDLADSGRVVRLQHGQQLAVGLPAGGAFGDQCWIEDPAAPVLEIEQEPSRAVQSKRWLLRVVGTGQRRLRFGCHDDIRPGPPRQVEFTIQVD